MSNFKREVEKINIPNNLHDRAKLGVKHAKNDLKGKNNTKKRLSLIAASCLITFSAITYTPVGAAIKQAYDKIFESQHIDDPGLKVALKDGHGQTISQTYYDKQNDIAVNFENVMTDNAETKLLLTFNSNTTDLENYYIDIYEGTSKVYLITDDGQRQELDNIGWGSRHYNKEENKVATALSFDSIKEYEGQNIRIEIENITIWDKKGMDEVKTVWPLEFNLDKSYITDREIVEMNKEFTFKNETYTIERVEYSELETRLVIRGSDMIYTDQDGNQYQTKSKLEHQFLNARQINQGSGYTVAEGKSGVFLDASGERIVPNFSKGEIESKLGVFIMVFAPVKDRSNVVLEVGEDMEIPLIVEE
ncbi:hypothetical protein [Pseudalkalibacillus berkeleyi]|uniref:DUF4179 domain-containing protein n=1 Tax=Pseudalkalibacillus berkeleyi TaxID=1069813 RepID=A0ABS9H1G5_9BACL|nr:hypothetical protein [Pseudalkalibacillus berkeleyi]MCF6138838.1 hypothetical protein [Pseudalkalibacillus berkeleyi]